jgi:hypothetical protein
MRMTHLIKAFDKVEEKDNYHKIEKMKVHQASKFAKIDETIKYLLHQR